MDYELACKLMELIEDYTGYSTAIEESYIGKEMLYPVRTTGVLVDRSPSDILIEMLSGILKQIIEGNNIKTNDIVFNKLFF